MHAAQAQLAPGRPPGGAKNAVQRRGTLPPSPWPACFRENGEKTCQKPHIFR
jgi:hypothetical protein